MQSVVELVDEQHPTAGGNQLDSDCKEAHQAFTASPQRNERVQPKKPRVPRADVVAVRVANEFEKQALLAADKEKFFTEPHYNGFPAVLVRLPLINLDELEELITDAWRCQAPRALVDALERGEA